MGSVCVERGGGGALVVTATLECSLNVVRIIIITLVSFCVGLSRCRHVPGADPRGDCAESHTQHQRLREAGREGGGLSEMKSGLSGIRSLSESAFSFVSAIAGPYFLLPSRCRGFVSRRWG